LPAFWYGEPIADFLARAKLAKPSDGAPTAVASANGAASPAAVPTNGVVRQDTPTASPATPPAASPSAPPNDPPF
jgi:hypothetical protein